MGKSVFLGKDYGSVTLAVFQFVIYSILGFIGFSAWAGTFSGLWVGDGYIGGHFVRWTLNFPLWGLFILISSLMSLMAANLLWRRKRSGAYLGVISFTVGFIVNLLFARNLLVHAMVGALIGWTLLTPLLLGWGKLENSKPDMLLKS